MLCKCAKYLFNINGDVCIILNNAEDYAKTIYKDSMYV